MMKFRIVVDSREQKPWYFVGYEAETVQGTLEAGDYSLFGFERRIAIERKELQDLVGCLGNGRERFERELARLRGYDFAAVVIESPLLALEQGMYRSALDSGAACQSIHAFRVRYRIPFVFCRDRAAAEESTYHMLRHFARDRWRENEALKSCAEKN